MRTRSQTRPDTGVRTRSQVNPQKPGPKKVSFVISDTKDTQFVFDTSILSNPKEPNEIFQALRSKESD